MLEPLSPSRRLDLSASSVAKGTALAILALLSLTGCGETVVEIKPSSGVIEVTVLTEGPGSVPDSFDVSLNGGESGSVAPNGTRTFTSLPRGNYHVALLEDAENCWYGVNGRMVTVEPDKTSFTTFLVRCR